MRGELDPGGDVGFVVEGGDYDFGAGGEDDGGGEVAEELGCGGAKDCTKESGVMLETVEEDGRVRYRDELTDRLLRCLH